MSMYIMGIEQEELMCGVAIYFADIIPTNHNLFI